jgi:hypothetical protein
MSHLTSRMRIAFGALAILAACGGGTVGADTAAAQQTQSQTPPASNAAATHGNGSGGGHDDMAGMDMGSGSGSGSGSPNGADAAKAANDGMDGHDMAEMAGHMYMTDLRPANAADQKRAAEIIAELTPAIAKYKDYKVALADGYKIFLPHIDQPMYHFTNYANTRAAAVAFDPTKPSSLLYKKTADGGYTLVGAMFTAKKTDTLDELNERVPLSVARWHKHTNICIPTLRSPASALANHQFRTITTEEACDAVEGRWFPEIFGWMVHVYPYESDPTKVWAH